MIIHIRRRHLLAALAAVAVLIALPLTRGRTVAPTAAGVTDWGLHFSREGEAPTGPASAAELAETDTYFIGNGEEKVLYLTFDAGFENGYTAPILDALKKHKAPATFFLVGNYFETAPDLVRRMVAEGHTVGNHTYHHPDMSAIATKEAFQQELAENEQAYKKVTGQEMPKLYRPPAGKYSKQNLQYAKELGYATVFWSLAYVDWYQDKQPTKAEAFQKLLPRTHPGAVVLLHSTSATNAAILDEMLTRWEEMGYRFGSLTDLCNR